jgi:hypothetical protein
MKPSGWVDGEELMFENNAFVRSYVVKNAPAGPC